MSQVASKRSVYFTVSQMLACFRDDEALRQSPLVSLHFRSVDDVASTAKRVRKLVISSIDRIVDVAAPTVRAIAQRQRHILLRHDLGGETRLSVCAELGITERQFYRDRRTASELLASHLRASLPKETEPAPAVTATYDPAELALQASLRMSAAGATRTALERVEAVALTAGDAGWRIVAMALQSQGSIDRGELSEGVHFLNSAEALLAAHEAEVGQERATALRAFFAMERGMVLWFGGAQREAISAVRNGVDRFYLSPSLSAPMNQLLMRGVVHCSAILTDAGELDARFAVLGDVRRCMDRLSSVPEHLELELRLELAKGQVFNGIDHEAVGRDFVEVMHRAQRLGLPVIAAEAARERGSIAARIGDLEQARVFQSAALSFAEAHDSALARAFTYGYASMMETRLGSAQRALALARSASDARPRGSIGSQYFAYVLARAQLACGFNEEALDSAEHAARSNALGEFGRGAALLLMAESAVALGRTAAASAYVDDAIARLGIYGQSYLMSQAHSVRKQLALHSALN
jgi:hypothetical protein